MTSLRRRFSLGAAIVLNNRLTAWLKRHRSSSRLGYLLLLASRVITSLMSLLWTRLLLGAMGKSLYGTFLSFQAVTGFGGLGDLGMGGAVGLRVGQYLGEGKEEELKRFLAGARAVFFGLALMVCVVFLVLAPWLPQWLGFHEAGDTGSLRILFALMGPAAAVSICYSYIGNLNVAGLNLVWPVFPALILSQLTAGLHFWFARGHYPLWVMYLPYVVNAIIGLVVCWYILKAGSPLLAPLRPLLFDWSLWKSLLERSCWIYLYSMGLFIYLTTDRLLINAGFGAQYVPVYQLNYKVCELALFTIATSSMVSFPKITQWLASSEPANQQRALMEADRLNQFQSFAGCAIALGYLMGNNLFMKLWLGEGMQASLAWQAAFALNLAISAGTQVSVDLAARLGVKGLRVGGLTAGLTALLNLVLSYLAMKAGSILGIALATVLAQAVRGFILVRFCCVELKQPLGSWLGRSLFMPLILVGVAGLARVWLQITSGFNLGILILIYLAMLYLAARVLGITTTLIRHELAMVRAMFNR